MSTLAQHTHMRTHKLVRTHTMCAWQIFRRTYNSPCLRVVHLPTGMLQSKAWPKLWVHATHTNAHTHKPIRTHSVCLADIQTHIQLTLPACRSPTCRHAAEQGLAKAVGARNTCVLGRDAYEVDAWGIDMFTRKNIFDGASTFIPLSLAHPTSQP